MSKPIKIFSDSIEGKALSQFHDAMKMDFAVQGALMPDAHAGYALPIGAVVATNGVVVPSWVGYDIGCGMCAVRTSFKKEDIKQFSKEIFDQIYRDIPTGFNHNKSETEWVGERMDYTAVVHEIIRGGALKQLGTLGSGNHFIEIGTDEQDRIWIVIHSGSRNVGHKIATHYMKLASNSDKAKEWHYGLDVNSQGGKDYITDLAFGLAFALQNRIEMIMRIEKAIRRYATGGLMLDTLINRNHNHAEQRAVRDENDVATSERVWIHRKGATHAEDGMLGVIPGNMRDGSFIVRGKGNPDSLFSSSHGAGRALSRTEAKAKLNMEEFAATMAEKGIQARVTEGTLDEAPDAYKNVFEVMALQTDLVEVLHHIVPLINIKG